MGGLVGTRRHVSPRRYKKRAHGRIIVFFFREPAQGRIFEWALLRGLPAGVIGSDIPWLECPACNALTWVITVTE